MREITEQVQSGAHRASLSHCEVAGLNALSTLFVLSAWTPPTTNTQTLRFWLEGSHSPPRNVSGAGREGLGDLSW